MAYYDCYYLSVSTQCVYVCVISLVYAKDLEPNQVWIKALNKYLLNEWMSFLWLKYFIFYYILIKSIDEGYASFLSLCFIFLFLAYITTNLWTPVTWCICHILSCIRTVSHVVPSTWNTLLSNSCFYQSPLPLIYQVLNDELSF